MPKSIEESAIVMLSDRDQVAIAKDDISSGQILDHDGVFVEIKEQIKKGHRFAIKDIPEGEFIRQNGFAFGQSKGIKKGELISSSRINDVIPEMSTSNYHPPSSTQYDKEYLNKTFSGYIRKSGLTGTRNYYLVVPTSMCVSETADQIVRYLESSKDVESKYPNVDGIVAISNTEGCGCAANEQIERFLAVLKGYIRHPNVGGCLIMDLGCEQTNYEKMFSYLKSTVAEELKPIDWITVQESGGTRLAIDKAVNIISHRLAEVNNVTRKPSPISELVIGTECGASDSFSGITANPVIGNAVDRIILGKGSGILSEIPEMLGTYEMLLPRFRTSEIAEKFNRLIEWYINIAKKLDLTLNDNLVPENIEGGLLNNYIKSIGAVMKGGSTVIEDVLEYAEPVREKGLSIMQGPGGDLESVTGIVASGATVICFSTGKGTTTGNAICPVIKISSNNSTFNKLPEDIDFNAGSLLTEQTTINKLGEELLEIVIDVASGKETWSERWKQRQFQVWTAGKLSL